MPEIMDDWYWFLMCYHLILFRPFEYMRIVVRNKHGYEKEE